MQSLSEWMESLKQNRLGKGSLFLAVIFIGAIALLSMPTNSVASDESMMMAVNRRWATNPILTIGETLTDTTGAYNPTTAGDYTPVGILDGMGAYELDEHTVRVLANHELLNFRGNEYEVSNGAGGTFSMTGARISYFDIDKYTMEIVDGGLAYNTIYDANGEVATDTSFLANNLAGFSRFCSASLFEANEFATQHLEYWDGDPSNDDVVYGLEDRIFFAGEEDGGNFNPVGGGEWALDPATGNLWHLPDLGRGAWENVTVLDTGNPNTVAILLADDSSPFNADEDEELEAAPLFLYIGEKDPSGDFPARNGLRGGTLYVWVANNGMTSPAEFNTQGKLRGRFVPVDNTPNLAMASETGEFGYDEYGYPTQSNLWSQAEALGAFGFSRPEDVATNPNDGSEFVLASTGVDTYVGGADTFGTMYTMNVNFHNLKATLRIIYDGDADPDRKLRSPDNLDWADNGKIYIQEDEAEEDSLDGEPLFGDGAANPNEAGVVEMNHRGKRIKRIANVDRTVILDPTTTGTPFDTDDGKAGEWESSGIVDVSKLFGGYPGSIFLVNVQAHGIEDQTDTNADSRINDNDLVEGGQLIFLFKDKKPWK